tara:strand:+ start:1307 stop:1540 length:234 start_codon:yes stop_codon:yes gene_type:complete
MALNLDTFTHCTSADPPKPTVKILTGERAGREGTLLGQWTYPFHLWVVKLHAEGTSNWAVPAQWAELVESDFKVIKP